MNPIKFSIIECIDNRRFILIEYKVPHYTNFLHYNLYEFKQNILSFVGQLTCKQLSQRTTQVIAYAICKGHLRYPGRIRYNKLIEWQKELNIDIDSGVCDNA